MTFEHQVRGQPGEQKIKEIIGCEVSGAGSPERTLAENVPRARAHFDCSRRWAVAARHPLYPRGKPQQTYYADANEHRPPAEIGHEEAGANCADAVPPLQTRHYATAGEAAIVFR